MNIGTILASIFGSIIEGDGTVVDNNLKINYPTFEAKAIKVIFGENDVKTKSIIFEKHGTNLDAVLATDTPEMFRISEKVKFKAFLRKDSSLWPASGPVYFDTRTWNGYIRLLAV